MDSQLAAQLREFISSEYLFGDDSRMPADTDSLLETGVLDSTGVLELIEFLEEKYAISVDEDETVPENLGSVANISRYVTAKLAQTAGVA
jgi:acyl carrier protein